MKVVVWTLLLFIALAPSLAGQTTNGSIEGTVSDPSGAAVGQVSVTARNLDTGLTVRREINRCWALFDS